MNSHPPSDRAGPWRPTAAHTRAVVGALGLAIVGVLARRPDLLVLVAPLAIVATWSVLRRPTTVPAVSEAVEHQVLSEGEVTRWRVDVDAAVDAAEAGAVGAEDVAFVVAPAPWLETDQPGGRIVELGPLGRAQIVMLVRPLRWGRHALGPATIVGTSAWGAFRWTPPSDLPARTLVALPLAERFDSVTTPVHAPGLVGVHRSPRQGSGVEFASIRTFQPGDRLRRIHWARSLRTGELHVTSTAADHDHHMVLVVDALQDVGTSGGVDGRASSLDLTVRAAAAIGEHVLSRGDRVGLVVLGSRGVQRLASAAGRHQFRRLLEVLTTVSSSHRRGDVIPAPRELGADALVVMLSPLASPTALLRAVTLADRGARVVVIDCLPPDIVDSDPGDPYVALAWRLRLLQRERELGAVHRVGVPVVPWRGPGSLDLVLRELDRHGRVGSGGRR